MNKTEELIVNEIAENLNWKEKIILKIFPKTFLKTYNIARVNTINRILNKGMYH